MTVVYLDPDQMDAKVDGLFSGQGRIGSQIYRNPKVPGEYLVG